MTTMMTNNQVRLIGLHGKAKHGKDTVYKILSEYLDFPVKRDAFADRLKLSAIRNFYPDISVEAAYEVCETLKQEGSYVAFADENGIIDGVSGREFLQHYGTEAHREVFADDFWIAAVLPDTSDKLNFGRTDGQWSLLVITDVRFPNEAEAVREAGGVVWQVIRPALDSDNDDHPSEKPLPRDLVDFVIVNDGDLDDLEDKVQTAWKFVSLAEDVRRLHNVRRS